MSDLMARLVLTPELWFAMAAQSLLTAGVCFYAAGVVKKVSKHLIQD